jgi:catechol 2,3-dioxygenase-like lactoylglutathione lyase family enzyme
MHVQRIDHMSLTVGEIERSAAFYGRFGFVPYKRYISAGPEVDAGADTERADMDIQWLRHPLGGPMLELIRYMHHPAERSAHNSRVGAAHLCFAIDDVFGAYDNLRREGITFLSPPNEDAYGVRWVYLRDPDGNAVELIQDPPATTPAETA